MTRNLFIIYDFFYTKVEKKKYERQLRTLESNKTAIYEELNLVKNQKHALEQKFAKANSELQGLRRDKNKLVQDNQSLLKETSEVRVFASLLTAYNSRYEYCFLPNGFTSYITI